MSQIPLHLADIGVLTVQKLLAQCVDLFILLAELMEGFETFYHALGVALNHHVGMGYWKPRPFASPSIISGR